MVQEIHYNGGPGDDKKVFAGAKGEDGTRGRDGRDATEDGEDGEDGEAGGEGHDGEDGHDAGQLDVMIEFESHDAKTNMRSYRVQTKAEGVSVSVSVSVCVSVLVALCALLAYAILYAWSWPGMAAIWRLSSLLHVRARDPQ